MKRTTQKERKENAKRFYSYFENCGTQTAIVVQRSESTSNPYVNRTQFHAVCGTMKDNPCVIAESSTLGIEGCFYELLNNIKPMPQKGYFEAGFKEWMKDNYGLSIVYNDGFVLMIQNERF